MGIVVLTVFQVARAGDDLTRHVFELEQRRIEVIERIAPSCVCVFGEDRAGGGSGVIIDERGYGLTNFHVVAGMMGTRKGLGGMSDGKLYPLEVLGIDVTGDVAMFRLTGRDRFPVAELGDSDRVRVGDEAIAIGNPFLLATDYTPTVTLGVVTGLHRYQGEGENLVYTDCIQTDAAINPGNSGGPLFDRDGRVIGINGRISAGMHKYARGRFNVGLGYAISINQIKRFIPHLRAGLLARHGTLDATVIDDLDRVIFNNMYEHGPAWDAGIRVSDRLVRFGGEAIRSANHFASLLGTYPERWPVPVTIESRNGIERKIVRLAPIVPQLNRPYETPRDVNVEAIKKTLASYRANVRAVSSKLAPSVWTWTASRVDREGRHTKFTTVDHPGGAFEQTQIDADGSPLRRIESDGLTVSLVEGDSKYLARPDETLLVQAMRALRGDLLAEVDLAAMPKVRHVGGDALVATDADGNITRTRMLETILWPLSGDVEMRVSFELDSHLPARVVVRDIPSDISVAIELDDYREAGGVRWPHRMRVRTPTEQFEETTETLNVAW